MLPTHGNLHLRGGFGKSRVKSARKVRFWASSPDGLFSLSLKLNYICCLRLHLSDPIVCCCKIAKSNLRKTLGFRSPERNRGETKVGIGGTAFLIIDYGTYQISS